MVGVDFIFLSKSDFCSSVLLRESFRLAVIHFWYASVNLILPHW